MSIILCDFMDPIWIDIFKKTFPKKTKKIFIDDNNFLTSLQNKNEEYYKFLLKNYCRRNLYYSNKTTTTHHKDKFFKRFYEISRSMIKRYDPYNHISKKEFDILFNDSISFWLRFLKHHKVSFFLCKTSPHQFYDYIIYACCKKLKIKTSFFCLTYLKDRVFLINDVDKRGIKIPKNFKKKQKLTHLKVVNSLISKISGNYKFSKPQYIRNEKNNFFKIFLFFNLNILKTIFYFFNQKKRSEIEYKTKKISYNSRKYFFSKFDMCLYQSHSLLKKFYLNVLYFFYSFKFKIPKKFIYFASQFQPEATSCPDGGTYNDNVKLLKSLRKHTPKDISIVYKEHPATFNPNPNLSGDIYRSHNYYKNLSKIKNLYFANLNYDSFELMDKSVFCLTVAGQLGFESSIRNNFCVIFTKTWYKNFPKIVYVKKTQELGKIYHQILKNSKSLFFKNKILNYLDFFLKKSLKTNICNDSYVYNFKDIEKISNYLKKNL
jgi:hypothetical protein